MQLYIIYNCWPMVQWLLAHDPMIAGPMIAGPMIQWLLAHGQPIPFCHRRSDTIAYLQTIAAKLWTHWSQPFCRRPQEETHGVLDTSFWNSSERTKQHTLYLHQWLLFLPEEIWSLIRLTSFPNTCFSTCLVMSFAVQLVSDFVFTPYVLRQRLESK
jgi:hypothetical protein